MTEKHLSNNIINYVDALCEKYKEEPLAQDKTQAIISETDLAIRTNWRVLGRHLSNMMFVVSYRYEAAHRAERSTEERKAFTKFQNRIDALTEELQTLQNPESPLSRALSNAAFLFATNDLPRPTNLSRLIELVDSEPAVNSDDRLQADIEAARSAISRLINYTSQDPALRAKARSVAYWNTFYIGEVLPALFEYHFGRPFGVSRHPTTGELGGPGVRFLSASTKTVGIVGPDNTPYSASTLVGYWKAARKNPMQDSDWVKNAAHQW